MLYINSKHTQILKKENYVMTCLWSAATAADTRFTDKEGKALLMTWYEFINDKPKKAGQNTKRKSFDDIIGDIIAKL